MCLSLSSIFFTENPSFKTLTTTNPSHHCLHSNRNYSLRVLSDLHPSLDDGIGNCRSDFQSSCTILSGKVFLSQQQHDSSSSSDNAGDSSSVSSAVTAVAVNGHMSLDLVPVPDQSLLPKPLTIANLSPTPMHGSCLRVAYQGVPDTSSAKKMSVQERRITRKAWSQAESSSSGIINETSLTLHAFEIRARCNSSASSFN
ncbi:hypothetical protein QJS10_CPB20g00302 [Acorus calamus]|uniref:Uncharacterized protein n=1 Tax=Acorus calamus TaxID=4465 RepID=A0AAV9CCP9_ACOCL|nr:hypothetical protein QJS10_CPB20g00302 [Acorus calamus]